MTNNIVHVLIIRLMCKMKVGVGLIKEFVNSGLDATLLHVRQVEYKVNSQPALWL